MPQLDLPIRRKPRVSRGDVSDDVILRLDSKLDAINLAQTVAGLDDQEICAELEIDPGHWSRMKRGHAHFPTNKELEFYDVVGNEIPLRWLVLKRGYELKRRLSEIEAENERLRAELDEAKRENETITKFMQRIGR